ncbi:NRDE family protein [Flagellimonas nanhaiensis]|uniref:NRDE family protein n=1 Tax=Flagellimonas nanhaiensis TaxID=2292706 RepID=A0A371JLY2_9FLAO|nr:NRDE family protein [Allomuricauda nanhaiensis]RDY58052.1 hypothetical protein DX873_16110 [Allomuricauda nanhaiensis]
MCTVSFISSGDKYFITSNRDEHISRPLAFEPKEEVINSTKVLFPKDPLAGGTWFAVNENGVVTVLLNGAFVRHTRQKSYSKSRGLVLLDIVSASDPVSMLQEMELYNIEPFTLVLFDAQLLEFRWDGNQKYFKHLDKTKGYIWSSVTLYEDPVITERASLFDEFLRSNSNIEASHVVDFHSNNHEDYENGFIIDRKTGLRTFSVTQAVLGEKDIKMRHLDLLNNTEYEKLFNPLTLT